MKKTIISLIPFVLIFAFLTGCGNNTVQTSAGSSNNPNSNSLGQKSSLSLHDIEVYIYDSHSWNRKAQPQDFITISKKNLGKLESIFSNPINENSHINKDEIKNITMFQFYYSKDKKIVKSKYYIVIETPKYKYYVKEISKPYGFDTYNQEIQNELLSKLGYNDWKQIKSIYSFLNSP